MISRSLYPVLLLAALTSCTTNDPNKPIAIVGATLIDGNGGPPVPDSIVIVSGNKIRAAGTRAAVPIPAAAEKIEATGQYLLPGLMDLHVHLGSKNGPGFTASDYTRDRVEKNLRAYLYFGVTTVRSVGTERDAGFDIRRDQRNGTMIGARLYTAGRGFTAKGGHPSQEIGTIARETDDPADARRQVAELAAQKVDLIKIWIDDLNGAQPKIKQPVIEAIIDEASKSNIPVVCHIYSLAETEHLISHGGAGFVHMIRDTETIPESTITRLRERKLIFTPTLVRQELGWLFAEKPELLDDPDAARTVGADIVAAVRKETQGAKATPLGRLEFDRAVRNSRKLATAGIPMAIGSDGGSAIDFPGLMTHRELQIFADGGFTPSAVITAATRNGALALGKLDELGTVEPGKLADLILVSDNPLQSVANLRKIARIMQNGEWVDREKLVVK